MMETRSVFFCNYSVGEAAYSEVPAQCRPFGTKALLIGGHRAMAAGRAKLEAALAGSGLEIVESVEYGRDCTMERINHWAEHAKELGVDMIFGMGGGRALAFRSPPPH